MTETGYTVPQRRRRSRLGLWIGLGAGVFVLLVVALGLQFALGLHYAAGYRRYVVTSGNMEPTLKRGHAVTAKLTGGKYRPKVGDIVVFTTPASWGKQDGKFLMRVIGTPNQHLSCSGGDKPLVVDGTPRSEPYAHGGCGSYPFDATVPAGRVWVAGDNRDDAYDSHQVYLQSQDATKATVPLSGVIGVVQT